MVMEEKYNDAYSLLLESSRVSQEIKDLISNQEFLDQNQNIIIDLARLLFLADSIEIYDNEIIVKKNCF